MKKGIILLFLFGIIGAACDEDKVQKNCEGGTCRYNIYTNSTLELEENESGLYANIAPGNNLVFEYQFEFADKEEIADDELTVLLRWEMPSDIDSFSFSEGEFEKNKVVFRRLCYCIRDDYEYASRGFINGVRQGNGSWDVFIDIEIDYYEDSAPENVEIQETFNVK